MTTQCANVGPRVQSLCIYRREKKVLTGSKSVKGMGAFPILLFFCFSLSRVTFHETDVVLSKALGWGEEQWDRQGTEDF